MKSKLIVAAIVSALTLGAALPAAADDFRDFGRGYHQDWRGRSDITVRTERGQFTVDRNDRLFQRLTDRPYRFRPGFTYIYTDRCNRDGCMVLEMSRWSQQPTDRFFAPYVRFERVAWNRDDSWRQDDRAFNGPQGPRDFDRRSDSRDLRGDDNAPPPAPPQNSGQYNGRDNGRGAFNGNGYQGGDRQLLGAPH